MKKIFILQLSLVVLCLSLAGCSGNSTKMTDNEINHNPVAQEPQSGVGDNAYTPVKNSGIENITYTENNLTTVVPEHVQNVFASTATLNKARIYIDVDNSGYEAMQSMSVRTLDAYNIDGNNYFKLRDVANILNDTSASFSVGWNDKEKQIELKTNEKYTPVGGEQELNWQNDKKSIEIEPQSITVKVDAIVYEMMAYNIDGRTYFQLSELGNMLNFEVNWLESEKAIQILTTE